MNEAKLQQGVDKYYQPKPDGDPDLVSIVRMMLVNAGMANKLANTYDINKFIVEANGKPSHVQRYLLNRYWDQQLMFAGKPSIEERYCLIPNGLVTDWLTLFESKVIPFVITNNLPIEVN